MTGNLLPDITETRYLGSSSKYWYIIYVKYYIATGYIRAPSIYNSVNMSVYCNVGVQSIGKTGIPTELLGNTKIFSDIDVNANNIGPLLIDRTTATKYRLYVDNGVLGIEVV